MKEQNVFEEAFAQIGAMLDMRLTGKGPAPEPEEEEVVEEDVETPEGDVEVVEEEPVEE